MGNIKFGKCVGEDVNGNRYYENMDYPHGGLTPAAACSTRHAEERALT